MNALAAASFAQLMASLVLFGAALFPVYALTEAAWRLLRWSAGAALVLGALALGAHAAALSATPMQLAATGIGRVWYGQSALALGLVIAAMMRARWSVLALSSLHLGLFGWVGHANAIAGWPGAALQALHLLATGGWIGGLAALILALRAAPSLALARRFSGAGLAFVLVIAATGAATLLQITGAALPMTAFGYGRLVSGKMVLFAGALALAGFNRLHATPRGAWMALRNSVAFELALLSAVIALAVALAGTEPLA